MFSCSPIPRRLPELLVPRARRDRLECELRHGRRAGARGRRPDRRSQQEEHCLAGRKLELCVRLRAVEGTGGNDRVAVVGDREDVACEAEPELGRDGACVAHAVDGEAEQDGCRLPLCEQRLERVLVDVVLELRLLDADVDDLVDARAVHVERRRVGTDHSHRHRVSERACRRDQLVGHVTHVSLHMLGQDEHAAHASRSLTSSTMRCATCAGPPSSISAPAPRGGVNIRRTRYAGSPASAETTAISSCSACLIARRLA